MNFAHLVGGKGHFRDNMTFRPKKHFSTVKTIL